MFTCYWLLQALIFFMSKDLKKKSRGRGKKKATKGEAGWCSEDAGGLPSEGIRHNHRPSCRIFGHFLCFPSSPKENVVK